jgi:hypothetical protein
MMQDYITLLQEGSRDSKALGENFKMYLKGT